MTYKSFTIEPETDPWALKYGMNFRYFRDENVYSAKTIGDAMNEIDEIEPTVSHYVKMNGRIYPFTWFADAVKFATMWNGELLTPICNP